MLFTLTISTAGFDGSLLFNTLPDALLSFEEETAIGSLCHLAVHPTDDLASVRENLDAWGLADLTTTD